MIPKSVADVAVELVANIGTLKSCAVAFSGGVDSAVICKAAYLALGENAIAVTSNSESVASGEVEQAQEISKLVGIKHVILTTREIEDPNYVENNSKRCFYCKTELYSQMVKLTDRQDIENILNGTNLDDLGDYRPGLEAASDHNVISPFIDLKIDKSMVRQLARYWELPVWNKPASPCLASRIAYGESVTSEKLSQIDAAERVIRRLGFPVCRVRLHPGNLARIEVPSDEISQLMQSETRLVAEQELLEIGFQFVTIDLQGFRSGNLNSLIQIKTK